MVANVVEGFVTKPPPVEEDPNAKELYADDFLGMSLTHGNLTLTFGVVRADHSKSPATNARKVVARIVLPVSVAANVEAILGDALRSFEAKGLIKREIAGPHGFVQ
jgi:hypothetical protein